MSDPDLWKLTLEIVLLGGIVAVGGYAWARYLARKFDRKYGGGQTPGEELPETDQTRAVQS